MRRHALGRRSTSLAAAAAVVYIVVCAATPVWALQIQRNVDDSLLPDTNIDDGADTPVWKFFPALWSRPVIASRTAALHKGPPQRGLQPSYACDVFDDSDGGGCEQPRSGDATIAYGGVLLKRRRVPSNTTGVARAMEWAMEKAVGIAGDDVAGKVGVASDGAVALKAWRVERAWSMELSFTRDGEAQVEFDLIVEAQRHRKQMVRHPVTMGVNYIAEVAATFAVTSGAGSDDGSGSGDGGAQGEPPVEVSFRVVVSYDVDHVYNLYQLTWDVTSSHPTRRTADEAADATSVSVAPDGGVASAQEPVDATTPRSTADADVDAASDGSGLDAGGPSTTPTTTTGTFMCYNVWNSNPPSWLWHNPRRRWELYSQRMDLLSEVVKGEAPDVLGLQEVRYDSTLAYATEHAQIKHLVQRLPGYQFVFQPANLYFDSAKFPARDEEGPGILSKHPIIASDYLLLSRDPSDKDDEHQRLCLHAAVRFPSGVVVDVYVVHLSLSEQARNRGVVEMWDFIERTSVGDVRMLMGDLNAEPDTAAIQYLQGLEPLRRSAGGVPQVHEPARLRDAWLEVWPEPEPRSTDPGVRRDELSFPSDAPKKRIDMILAGYKDSPAVTGEPATTPEEWPQVTEVYLVGQDPVLGTEHNHGKGYGMVHASSPIYASDHRAVVAKYRLRQRPTAPAGTTAGHE